jgi:hypothetical protein
LKTLILSTPNDERGKKGFKLAFNQIERREEQIITSGQSRCKIRPKLGGTCGMAREQWP